MTKASIVEFQKNRPNFPDIELDKYEGQWVAFSMDAKHILASGETLEDLIECAKSAGVDMQEVAIEHVVVCGNEVNIGAADLELVYLKNEMANG